MASILLRTTPKHYSLFEGQIQNSFQSFIEIFLTLGDGEKQWVRLFTAFF